MTSPITKIAAQWSCPESLRNINSYLPFLEAFDSGMISVVRIKLINTSVHSSSGVLYVLMEVLSENESKLPIKIHKWKSFSYSKQWMVRCDLLLYLFQKYHLCKKRKLTIILNFLTSPLWTIFWRSLKPTNKAWLMW